jgi:hypothetical protein
VNHGTCPIIGSDKVVIIRTTISSPGSIDTLLIEGISGLELKSANDEDMKIAIEPASMLVPLDLQLNNPPM